MKSYDYMFISFVSVIIIAVKCMILFDRDLRIMRIRAFDRSRLPDESALCEILSSPICSIIVV
jgi:hypothetical protein